MTKRSLFGFTLASTLSLALLVGCNPPTTTAPGQTQSGASSQAAPTAQPTDSADASAPLLDVNQQMEDPSAEASLQDMNTYDLAAEDLEAGAPVQYGVLAADVSAKGDAAASGTTAPKAPGKGKVAGKPKPGYKGELKNDQRKKLEENRRKQLEANRQVMKARSEEQRELAKAAQAAPWEDNGDGTSSKNIEFDVKKTVNGKDFTRHVKMIRTVDTKTKLLINLHTEFTEAYPNGMTSSIAADKVLHEAGGYKVTQHAEFTFKDGRKRVADSIRDVAGDGTVTGSGTTTFFDASGKQVRQENVTYTGTESKPKPVSSPKPKPSATPSADAAASGSAPAATGTTAAG